MSDVAGQRPWATMAAAGIGAALAIGALVTLRANGGYCLDGIEGVESVCTRYSSASGAIPGTIAVLVLLAALIVAILVTGDRGPATRRIVVAVYAALIVLTVVVGVISNLSIIEYPEGYPG